MARYLGEMYEYPQGPPAVANQGSIPMLATATLGLNNVNAVSIRLNNANPTHVVQSEDAPWMVGLVIGLEVVNPIRTVATDYYTFEDFQVNGGATLFPQEGEVPGDNYLTDETGRGGGAAALPGLRTYPELASPSRLTMTVRVRNPLDGAGGGIAAAGVIVLSGINCLLDDLHDDVYGDRPVGPYADVAKMLRG